MTNEEAIKEIKRWTPILLYSGETCTNHTMEAQLKAIASLENEKPKGYWIESDRHYIICSNCGQWCRDLRVNHMNYCNCCGADMRGDE